jgi:hypothetical protein
MSEGSLEEGDLFDELPIDEALISKETQGRLKQGLAVASAARGVSFNPQVQYYEPPPDWDSLMYAEDESLHSETLQPEHSDLDDDDDDDTPEFSEEFFDSQPFDGNLSLGRDAYVFVLLVLLEF